ncbi:ATP-binding protein [Lyngbya aestuarii]|uniref:ATP-binding protein n=1 Tax=Lyngbya aestuarii TaxID=118322 RepID=UPI00403DFD92
MYMVTPSLREFAQSVPVCEQASGLKAVLEIFRSSPCDVIVILSEQQRPLGVVSLSRVMPHLLSQVSLGETHESRTKVDLDKPLCQLEPPIVESLVILPDQLNLSQFLSILQEADIGNKSKAVVDPIEYRNPETSRQTIDSKPYALVDQDGKFLGLLNSWLVLKSLASNRNNNHFPTPLVDLENQQTITEINSLNSLVQLLEQLPLPLSLQTGNGQVLTQNLAWRREIGTTVKLDCVEVTTNPTLNNIPPELPEITCSCTQWVTRYCAAPASKNAATVSGQPGDYRSVSSPGFKVTSPEPSSSSIKGSASENRDAALKQRTDYTSKQTTAPPPSSVNPPSKQEEASQFPWLSPCVPTLPTEVEKKRLVPAATGSCCAIDTFPQAGFVGGGVSLSRLPQIEMIADALTEKGVSAPACEGKPTKNERLFSFIKIPLSSPSSSLQERELERHKEDEQINNNHKTSTPALRERDTESVCQNCPHNLPATSPELTASPSGHLGVDLPLTQESETDSEPCSAQVSSTIPALWIVLGQDTTEQHFFTQELAVKNADLLKLNRLKDEFLACISHELKTPLTAVLGLSSLLKDQALGKLNERQARYAQLIYQSGRQLMTVLNDILDLTRMETGQLEVRLEPVEIESACTQAYSQARQRLYAKDPQKEESTEKTKFTLEIEPNLEFVVADELRLRQMLGYLLENALKFTETSGEIGLKVNLWQTWITFTVWDTGIGIPPWKQQLLLGKLQQGEESLTHSFEGAGLGLILTQRLARLHGGDVSFISQTNQGSQFTLLLPYSPSQQGSSIANGSQTASAQCETDQGEHLSSSSTTTVSFTPIPEQCSPRSSHLVLVAETVPQQLEALMEQLNNLDYRVIIARSGTEALEKARTFQPRAVLINASLLELAHPELLNLFRSDAQTSQIPIWVTASQEEQQSKYDKADGFLSLPIQQQKLRQSLTGVGEEQSKISRSLTILHLSPVERRSHSSTVTSKLTDFLSLDHSEFDYRVLEADDLEQAELLARVWQPDVVLLDEASTADPFVYLKHFACHSCLSSLPLVTLDHQTTAAANQITGLSVFPCLAPDNQQKIAALLQVIQVAASING